MQCQDDAVPRTVPEGEPFAVEDQAFNLEALAVQQAKKRILLAQDRKRRDLAAVAEMMDCWTRLENTGYANALIRRNQELDALQHKLSQALSVMNQLAAAVTEMSAHMDIIAPNRPVRYNVVPHEDQDLVRLEVERDIIDLTTEEELTQDSLMDELLDM